MTIRPLSMREIHDWALALPGQFVHAVTCFGGDRSLCCPDGGVGVFEGDRLVALASVSREGESYSGEPAVVGVLTDPAARRRGYGRAALVAAVARMGELGLDSPYRCDCVTAGGLALCRSLPEDVRALLDVRDLTGGVL